MSEEEKVKMDKRNEENPPCMFRWSSRVLKRKMERMAKTHHRTLAGELNAAAEAHVAGGDK